MNQKFCFDGQTYYYGLIYPLENLLLIEELLCLSL